MSRLCSLPLGLALLSTILVAACSTPQPALDQANNGVALTMALQSELANLRAVQARIAEQRMESIRRQRELLLTYQSDAAFGERVSTAAGKTAQAKLAADLRALADSRADDERKLQAKKAELDAQMAKLLSPVPDRTAQVQATQSALAALGDELPFSQRLKIAASFAADIKESIKANEKKADEAAGATPAAPAQAPASAPLP